MSDYLCCCCCCYCTDKVEDEGHVKCPGKPEWISTKNQLPDVSDHYLAYFVIRGIRSSGGISTAFYSKENHQWVCDDKDLDMYNINDIPTHWMRLPEIPQIDP